MRDETYMRRALHLAERGRGRTSPNPLVGAVVVSADGVVVGSGYHDRAGDPHAEAHALAAAGAQARGATLYCTLEPCSHHGRTPPCAARVAEAGIARVVAACEDPNPLVSGGGFRFLRDRGVTVDTDVCRREALLLNDAFVTRMTRGRPLVILKVALSLDGRIAARPDVRTHLTSRAADRRVHALRAEVDAIGIGSGTLLADDPLLTVRGIYRARPLTRVIFDRRLRTPPDARVLTTCSAGPVVVLTSAGAAAHSRDRVAALERAGALVEPVEEGGFIAGLARLSSRGIGSLLLEGGAALHAAAWEEGAVDRVQLYLTPRTLGGEGLAWLPSGGPRLTELHDVRVEALGPDVLIEGYVHRLD